MNPLAKRPGEESLLWLAVTNTRSLAARPTKVRTVAGGGDVSDIEGADPTSPVKVDDGVPLEGFGLADSFSDGSLGGGHTVSAGDGEASPKDIIDRPVVR